MLPKIADMSVLLSSRKGSSALWLHQGESTHFFLMERQLLRMAHLLFLDYLGQELHNQPRFSESDSAQLFRRQPNHERQISDSIFFEELLIFSEDLQFQKLIQQDIFSKPFSQKLKAVCKIPSREEYIHHSRNTPQFSI